jgi:hypothetical protein
MTSLVYILNKLNLKENHILLFNTLLRYSNITSVTLNQIALIWDLSALKI